MKDKITKLRDELKQLNKTKKVYIDKKPIKYTKLPHIKKEKKIVIEEKEINNNILDKL
jgi:hypothetical protein